MSRLGFESAHRRAAIAFDEYKASQLIDEQIRVLNTRFLLSMIAESFRRKSPLKQGPYSTENHSSPPKSRS
jgi:hypothetical protein